MVQGEAAAGALTGGSRHERPGPYRGAMKPTEFWIWRIRDELTGKMRKTRHRMDEATAMQRHPEALKVPGTCEVRNLPENDDELHLNTTSSWHQLS